MLAASYRAEWAVNWHLFGESTVSQLGLSRLSWIKELIFTVPFCLILFFSMLRIEQLTCFEKFLISACSGSRMSSKAGSGSVCLRGSQISASSRLDVSRSCSSLVSSVSLSVVAISCDARKQYRSWPYNQGPCFLKHSVGSEWILAWPPLCPTCPSNMKGR